MSRFERALVEVDQRLKVAEPSRSRILLEIAADMEGLFLAYRRKGMEESDAERATLDHFDLSQEALEDLVRVHETTLERSLDGLAEPVRSSWARLLMVGLALFVVAGSGVFLIDPSLYRVASRVVLVVLPLLIWGFWVAARQALVLVQARDRWSKRLRRGHHSLLGLAVGIVIVASGGLLIELFLCALAIREAPSEAFLHLVTWIHMVAATLVVAFSGALMLAFLWFFLDAQIRRAERAVSQALLGAVS